MKARMILLIFTTVLLLTMLYHTAAFADSVTYSYIGPNFDTFNAWGIGPTHAAGDHIEITLTFDDVLPDISTLSSIPYSSLLSWTVTDGLNTITNTSTDLYGSYPHFSVTVLNGDIITHDMTVVEHKDVGTDRIDEIWITSNCTQDLGYIYYGVYTGPPLSGPMGPYGYTEGRIWLDACGGEWARTGATSPGTVPLPSTVILLGTGLFGLGGIIRKKNKH